MARQSRLQIAKSDIFDYFNEADVAIYTRKDIGRVLDQNRKFWRLAKRTTIEHLIDFLKEKGELHEHEIRSPNYPEIVRRYVWGNASKLRLATSIRPDSYISHGTAMYLHGLTDLVPKTIYINKEQSPKDSGGQLSQRGIDLAFSRKQRTSRLTFELNSTTIVVIAGKNTKRLEVESIQGPEGDSVDCTSLERTLIDIVVRPAYAGGIRQVIEAYQDAKETVSINRLKATLKKLGYVYPYHQAIGFIMEYVGYPERKIAMLFELGAEYDFYLTHGMKGPQFSKKWRLHFPRELDGLNQT